MPPHNTDKTGWRLFSISMALLQVLSVSMLGYIIKTQDELRDHNTVLDSRVTKVETQLGFILRSFGFNNSNNQDR